MTYARGGTEVSVTATVGRTEFEEYAADGTAVRSESRDYIIRVVDLGDNIEQDFKPERGDVILETVNGTDLTAEVMSIASGTEPWRFHDRDQTQYRITTKIVGREAS